MDVGAVTNLGVAAFAIWVMWLMYKSAANERKRNDDRMDAKDKAFRDLEEQVRTNITAQLMSSTSALQENAKVNERVLAFLTSPVRKSR